MDHYQLPRDPRCRPPRVAYVCSVPYDEGDFLTYPSRGGQRWSRHFESEWRLAFSMAEHINPSEDGLLQDFFQRWLFFGLLHAVLSQPQFDLYNAEHYIDRDENGEPIFVHTRNLAARLELWSDRVQQDDVDKPTIRTRLLSCLHLAHDTLSSLRSAGKSLPNRHPNFNQAIKCSIEDLCGTISAFGEIYLGSTSDNSWNMFHFYATDIDTSSITHMKDNGWCERDIMEEDWDLHTPASYWYLKALGGVSPQFSHRDCSREHCTVETIHRDSYKPGHVSQDCGCLLVGPKHDDVADILNNDQIPVLDIMGQDVEDISVNAVPSTKDVAYVALSHVWADGLGNPSSMAVHQCQLLRLRDFLKHLYGRTFRWYDGRQVIETRKLHLWIDPLLVPIAKRPTAGDDTDFYSRPEVIQSWDLYRRAMGKIREVYLQATYVLVLDSALVKLPWSEMDAIEAIMRVHTSRWVRRLWTLQEAALADKLLIQFADEAIDYRDLASAARSEYEAPMTRRLCEPIIVKWITLRGYRGLQDSGGVDLISLSSTMRLRRATEQSDQPLCAATILNLDTTQVATGKSLPERMMIFWSLLSESSCVLPDNIVFNRMPRLTMPGYRWAPLAIAGQGDAGLNTIFPSSRTQPAKVSPQGLIVSFPCIRISACHFPFGIETPFWQNLIKDRGWLDLRSRDGRWFRVSSAHPDHTTRDHLAPWVIINNQRASKWHVLFDGADWDNSHTQRFGLLGTITPQASGPPIFRSQILVTIMERLPADQIVAEAAVKHALTIRRGYLFRIYQLLFALKTLSDFWFEFLPERLQHPLKSLFVPFFSIIIGACLHRIQGQISRYGQTANQTADMRNAMSRTSQTVADAQALLLVQIGLELISHRANIDKWMSSEHKWCVD